MRVTIWDLDYFHTKEKVNCFNPDVMKISSYHKQLGDTINFVTTVDDIRRPYDLYYIIKENNKTPNPPLDFFTNSKVKWWGNAYRARVKWKMSDAMLGCRPDYLLYPEYNTPLERAEHVRFFNSQSKLLPIYQDYHNSFKNKKLIITDENMWYADTADIITALKRLTDKDIKNLYFLKPIRLQTILQNKELKELFLSLKFTTGVNFRWYKIKQNMFTDAVEFFKQLKQANPSVGIGNLIIDYSESPREHWTNKDAALKDFDQLKKMIVCAKKNKIMLKIELPSCAAETPYFYLFSVIAEWTWKKQYRNSWLNYITHKFAALGNEDAIFYWCTPKKWHEVFRDLLRQTYTDKDFLLCRWGNNIESGINIPWNIWEKEFKYGL